MATESEHVKAPAAVQPEVPVEELKVAAKGKINEFVDKANDPASKEKLKQGVDATAQDAGSTQRGLPHHDPSLLESLRDAITSTAQSAKDAFMTPSPTAHQHHATPTSTNLPVTHFPAQSVSESLGQTAAALRDAIKSTWAAPPAKPDVPQPKN